MVSAHTDHIDDWFLTWQQRYPLPDNYVTLDLVTTGVDHDEDLILAVGLGTVRQRQLVEHRQAILNWTNEWSIDQNWLDERLLRVASHYQTKTGKVYPFGRDVLRQAPGAPQTVLAEVIDALQKLRVPTVLVGHCIHHFDLAFLKAQASQWLGQHFGWSGQYCLDVGLMEKARQLGTLPQPGEALATFWQRVQQTRAGGVGWSLSHCLQQYEIDLQDEPEVGDDTVVVHQLLEGYRRRASLLAADMAFHETAKTTPKRGGGTDRSDDDEQDVGIDVFGADPL